MKQPLYIAVEGPIGVGKTTLSRFISEQYGFHHLKEIVEENPFLSKFYDDVEEWSFQTEMFFLCNRYKQIEDIQKKFLQQSKNVVADYHIFKNMIFAKRTLNAEQFKKYEQIYDILTKDMPKPNVVIHLNASVETLMKRIRFRGRNFEEGIAPEYLVNLSNDYKEFFQEFKNKHPEIPVLEYSGDDLDFVNNEEHLKHILQDVSLHI